MFRYSTPKNCTRMDASRQNISELLATYEQGRVLRDGLTVALAGSPNAGKSSLFNALLKEQRAIVTNIPGTTRDYLEEKLDLENLPLVLIDTAGVRETEDPVEREGVSRSHERIHNADLTLLLVDGTDAPQKIPRIYCSTQSPIGSSSSKPSRISAVIPTGEQHHSPTFRSRH